MCTGVRAGMCAPGQMEACGFVTTRSNVSYVHCTDLVTGAKERATIKRRASRLNMFSDVEHTHTHTPACCIGIAVPATSAS